MAKLRRLRAKFVSDNEALGLLIELYEEKTERLIGLQELLHYRDGKETDVKSNGKEGGE